MADNGSPKKILSLEDILHGLSDLAREGDGAQQTQAYRMLLAQKGSGAALLDEPETDEEVVELLSRCMRPAGKELCKVAYHRAFRMAKDQISDRPNLTADLLAPDIVKQVETIKGLRALYRFRPELKRPGFPKGFPARSGPILQQRWCQNAAIKILLDEEMSKMDQEDKVENEEADRTEA